VSPVAGIFLAGGAALACAWGLAGALHPRLGRPGRAELAAAKVQLAEEKVAMGT
jgi:hypothetical protein